MAEPPSAQHVVIQPDVRRRRISVILADLSPLRLAVRNTPYESPSPAPPDAVGVKNVSPAPANDSATTRFVIEMPDADFWSPETPTLYDLEIHTTDSDAPHAIPFGLRELTVKDNRFHLNNRPYFLKGALPQDAPLTPSALDDLKRAGFNLVSSPVTSLDDDLLDHADRVGIFIQAEVHAALDEALYRRLRNHPALALWSAPTAEADQLRLSDPSRIIFIAQSGDTAYYRPYKSERDLFDLVAPVSSAPVDLYATHYMEQVGEPDRLTIAESNHEHRDHPVPPDLAQGFAARELDRVFGDHTAFQNAVTDLLARAQRRQMECLRANEKLSGYRLAPPDPASFDLLAPAQARLRPIIQMSRTNLVPRQEVPVTILLVNDERLEDRVDLSLQVIGPTNQVLWKKRRSMKLPKHGRELWSGAIAASGATGPHQFVARIIAGGRTIAESVQDFHVFEHAQPYAGDIHLMDPAGQWASRCRKLARLSNLQAPIHVIPPLANTIRAYPDNELAQILGQVREGAVAIFYAPPSDWNELAELFDTAITATPRNAVNAVHYAKLHPVFEGLPARALLGAPYRNVVPYTTFAETGEQDICGAFFPNAPEEPWGSNILVRRYASGRIVFTHLRIMEHLGDNPLADRLFVNMLDHFARRSVPSTGILPVNQQAVEWLRTERIENLRRWLVIGPFPNWRGEAPAFPPEEEIKLDATYPGWYKALSWRSWYSLAESRHTIDLAQACNPAPIVEAGGARGLYYAYAEFNADRRGEVLASLNANTAAKLWLNGNLIHDTPDAANAVHPIEAYFRQGRNTLLLKLSTTHPRPVFRFNYQPPREPMHITWWK